jgi:hypothetical protein
MDMNKILIVIQIVLQFVQIVIEVAELYLEYIRCNKQLK